MRCLFTETTKSSNNTLGQQLRPNHHLSNRSQQELILAMLSVLGKQTKNAPSPAIVVSPFPMILLIELYDAHSQHYYSSTSPIRPNLIPAGSTPSNPTASNPIQFRPTLHTFADSLNRTNQSSAVTKNIRDIGLRRKENGADQYLDSQQQQRQHQK